MPYMLYTDANTYNILSGTCKHLHNCRQIISNTKVHWFENCILLLVGMLNNHSSASIDPQLIEESTDFFKINWILNSTNPILLAAPFFKFWIYNVYLKSWCWCRRRGIPNWAGCSGRFHLSSLTSRTTSYQHITSSDTFLICWHGCIWVSRLRCCSISLLLLACLSTDSK